MARNVQPHIVFLYNQKGYFFTHKEKYLALVIYLAN